VSTKPHWRQQNNLPARQHVVHALPALEQGYLHCRLQSVSLEHVCSTVLGWFVLEIYMDTMEIRRLVAF
jgi:hypothetical protein